jgi:hypothetical protein
MTTMKTAPGRSDAAGDSNQYERRPVREPQGQSLDLGLQREGFVRRGTSLSRAPLPPFLGKQCVLESV